MAQNKPKKENSNYYSVLLVFSLLLAVIAGKVLGSFTNTLGHNGNWISSKAFLEKPVSTAIAFMKERPALARERLNLGAWNGYNEIYYKNVLVPQQITLRVRFNLDSYLAVLFNKDDSGNEGILLGPYYLYKNVYFKAKPSGEFIEKKFSSPFHTEPNRWWNLKLASEGGKIAVYLNGVKTYTLDTDFRRGQVGLRGGEHDVFVDDVEIISRDGGKIFKDNFANNKTPFSIAALFLLFLALNWFFVRILPVARKEAVFSLVYFESLGLILLLIFFCYDFYLGSARYPKYEGALKAREETWIENEEKKVESNVGQYYSRPASSGEYRIMFLGSSQTWGAGALKKDDVFTEQIQDILNRDNPQKKFLTINAAICGLNAKRVFELYSQNFVKASPDLVVVNLSNNDSGYDERDFAAALEKICSFNEEKKIKTIFILEPNSLEHRFYLPVHETMRDVADKYGIKVLNLQQFLAENHENGFLWWDSVHMSSFGHKLAAGYLAKEIKGFLSGGY